MSPDAVPAAGFDRELSLDELLRSVERARLADALVALLGAGLRLSDVRGRELLTRGEVHGGARLPVRGEMEPIGYLECDATEAQAAAAVVLLQLILRANARYLMASELHLQAVHEDYAELQRRHAALQESEARYRELALHLEQRVAEQVQTIEATQRRLYQSEKLASVGQLAAGVAHEINNPIGFIASNLNTAQGYLQRLGHWAEQLPTAPDLAAVQQAWTAADLGFVLQDFSDLIDESRSGAARVARIVADLKGFSRVDQGGEEAADINAIIRQVCNVAAGQIRGRLAPVFVLGEVPPLRCNAAQLGQVILNLLLNAADAVTPPGEVTFETSVAQGQLRLRVHDNGSGIPPAVMPRIFDPFFTTKEVGRGTGLGLTVSNDIVRAHGGRIEVDSRPGAGTTFTVWLPLR
jgi:signal transduction histidine kinase